MIKLIIDKVTQMRIWVSILGFLVRDKEELCIIQIEFPLFPFALLYFCLMLPVLMRVSGRQFGSVTLLHFRTSITAVGW